jgi:hypothetical protein
VILFACLCAFGQALCLAVRTCGLTPETRHFRLGVHDDEPVLSIPPLTPGACQDYGTRERLTWMKGKTVEVDGKVIVVDQVPGY